MALIVHGHQTGIQCTGTRAEVPSDPFARLKYYLNCVKFCIPGLSSLPSCLTDQSDYDDLDLVEKTAVVALAMRFDIKVMMKANLFIPDFDKRICETSSNEFFKITDKKVSAIATSSVIVAGERVQVTKLMLFTESWAKSNFFTPLEAAVREINREAEELRRRRAREESARRVNLLFRLLF
jgi:hypothetical protein